jgi:hypothetical protein
LKETGDKKQVRTPTIKCCVLAITTCKLKSEPNAPSYTLTPSLDKYFDASSPHLHHILHHLHMSLLELQHLGASAIATLTCPSLYSDEEETDPSQERTMALPGMVIIRRPSRIHILNVTFKYCGFGGLLEAAHPSPTPFPPGGPPTFKHVLRGTTQLAPFPVTKLLKATKVIYNQSRVPKSETLNSRFSGLSDD